ncbi:MAG: 7-carboxy-7-deazaguanine synthase QueE [Bacteroidota bacterium]
MEAFHTIQGEGYHTGTPAYFIRTGGCDVGCHWCDVKESWDSSKHPETDIAQLIANARACESPLVVITGGEPMMYDMAPLTTGLRENGLNVHLETSGAYELTGDWDWICFSPKKFKAPLQEYYERSHELKVIIYNRSDFQWAQDHAFKMHADAKLFLQPEWSKADEVMPLIVQFVKENPVWRISLQTHKFLNIP